MSLICDAHAKRTSHNCKSAAQNAYYGRPCRQPNFLMTLSLRPLPRPTLSQPEQGYELGALDLHIHQMDIRQFTAANCADAERIMNTAERERAQKFVRGRESYIASRWLLRSVLAHYLGVSPAAVEFLRTDKGKPYLANSDLHFSLSHSGDWAVLAVSKAELVGVDVEAIKTTRDLMGIAESYYHPHEFSHMQSLDSVVQADYFYRLWTLKEAFFKALGTGISAGLEKVHFVLDAESISAAPEASLNASPEWQFHQWELSATDYCALAYTSAEPVAVKWFNAFSAPAFP